MLLLQSMLEGALHVLAAPLGLAALLATFLMIARAGAGASPVSAGLLVTTAMLARWVPESVAAGVAVPSVLSVFGGMLASNALARRVASAAAAAVVGGAAVGLGGGMQMASWPEAAGAGVVYALFVCAASLIFARLPDIPRLARAAALARRMAGAWIAAVGAILLALWWQGVGA
jgi:hypothetical protein